jgi:hypothetical protein
MIGTLLETSITPCEELGRSVEAEALRGENLVVLEEVRGSECTK